MGTSFRDRAEAGRWLSGMLADYADRLDVQILSLPYGGVPVAFALARELNLPFDVFDVHTLAVPGQPDIAMGAVASGGVCVVNGDVVRAFAIPDWVITDIANRQQRELTRRAAVYRGDRPVAQIQGRTIILVDDGLAADITIQAAVAALRSLAPVKVILAVPASFPLICDDSWHGAEARFRNVSGEDLYSVGMMYEDFYWVLGLLVHGAADQLAPLLDPRRDGEPVSAQVAPSPQALATAMATNANRSNPTHAFNGNLNQAVPPRALYESWNEELPSRFGKHRVIFEVLFFGFWAVALLAILWLLSRQ